MSCYITSGEAFGCSDGIGGVKKIWVVGGTGSTLGGVTGFTYDADGAITGATSVAGTELYGFELKEKHIFFSTKRTKELRKWYNLF